MSRLLHLSAVLTLLLGGAVLAGQSDQGRTPGPGRTALASTAPELPRAHVDTSVPRQTGRVIAVPAGGDLNAALASARPGDTVTLQAGAVYEGPFTLPQTSGPGTIVITTSAAQGGLPAAGARINPSHAASLATLTGPGPGPALVIPAGASGYRLVGLEIRPAPGRFLVNLVAVGDGRGPRPPPSDIVFDRCYLHGDPARGGRRGIAMNGGATAVIDSYIADFKEVGADSQAIAGWDGTGPYAIVNSYLEAAGENVLFGGADPSTPNLVPSDIEIRRNHLAKPLTWKSDDPRYAGTAWTVKNLLELKNARRVLIDGNVLEFVWPAAQNGFAVLFTVRNQDGRSPWSTIEDVTFTNNIVRHAAGGINILGHDDVHPSGPTRRLLIRNNLFEDLGGPWGDGRLFQLLNGADDVTIEHNTADTEASTALQGGDTTPHARFVFRDNIVSHSRYGVIGSGTAIGRSSLERYFPEAAFEGNVIIGGGESLYPRGNFFPGSSSDVGFVDRAARDYQLAPGSRFLGRATDGTNPGVDMVALRAAGQDAVSAASAPRDPGPLGAGVLGAALLADPSHTSLVVLLWVSAFLLVYTYAGYPLLIAAVARIRPRVVPRRRIEPTVSILVVAHNEVAAIAARIANLFALDYPSERLDVVIASDGSTDNTVAEARAAGGSRLRVASFDERRGKASVINDLIPTLKGEIVVLADTRQRIEPGALCALVAPFADPSVGAVSGELMLDADSSRGTTGRGVGFYWRYEKFIRQAESAVDSTVGATGAVYAIRKTLFEPISRSTILDDVIVPMQIVRRGYRVLFEPGARAYDRSSATAQGELARKVRTSAGNFQLLAEEPWLLLPTRNRLWLQTVSHKVLRLLLPALHLAAFGASLALARSSPFYLALATLQTGFYGLALVGAVVRTRGTRFARLMSVPYIVCLLLWATVAGFLKFVRGLQSAAWEPTHESPEAANYWAPDTITSRSVPPAVKKAVSTSSG